MPSRNKQGAVSFAAESSGSGMDSAEVRRLALEAVKTRAGHKSGAGRLVGKVGVITGVGPETGIGAATAKLFAREGAAHLYLLDAVDNHLPSFVDRLRSSYPKVKIDFVIGDAASPDVIKPLVDRVMADDGRLDFFFANAGVTQVRTQKQVERGAGEDLMEEVKRTVRTAQEYDESEFSEIMRINALSAFLAIKYAAPAMGETRPDQGKTVPGGSIVLTASIAGIRSNAGPVPYSASKAAVISIAQTAAYELAGQNVRVNAVCPGLIQTDMTRMAFQLAEMSGKIDKIGVLNPLRRQGIGHEVAHVALFLASEEGSYVNGHALAVDGGLNAGHPYVRSRL